MLTLSRHMNRQNNGINKISQPHDIVAGTQWQGRRDSNTQPTVLETVALPLSHSPKFFANSVAKR